MDDEGKATDPPHPVQPLVTDPHGVVRFKRNTIVRWMLDTARASRPVGLATIWFRPRLKLPAGKAGGRYSRPRTYPRPAVRHGTRRQYTCRAVPTNAASQTRQTRGQIGRTRLAVWPLSAWRLGRQLTVIGFTAFKR